MISDTKITANFDDTSLKGEPVIQIIGLSKSFGENHVLRNFSMTLHKGENVIVLGKSGSGKSVLIKCIIGLIEPDAGTINVLGKNITGLNHKELDEMRVKIGFLFQSNALYDSMTVRENLEFPLRRHGINKSKEQINELVLEALTNVGLAHTINMRPAELSGGMRKRIALARTLILKPEIILYDEPTTGLDTITSKEISQLIMDIRKRYGASSIIITHDMACARKTADRIIIMNDGQYIAEGSYTELENSPDEFINSFFKL